MLRAAVASDRDLVLAWRNHPDVRAVSLTQHEITPAEHAAWWEAAQSDPRRRILIYERNGVPAGVVTFFDLDSGRGWWGYYLDNAGLTERGELMPAWMQIQREAVRYAGQVLQLTSLDAETLGTNEAVLNVNKHLGFDVVSTCTRTIDGVETQVVHSRKTFTQGA